MFFFFGIGIVFLDVAFFQILQNKVPFHFHNITQLKPQFCLVLLNFLYFQQEDSRRYAGKQIHPFFQSLKMGKKSQEVVDVESNWYSSEGERKSLTFSPIHVFEIVKV